MFFKKDDLILNPIITDMIDELISAGYAIDFGRELEIKIPLFTDKKKSTEFMSVYLTEKQMKILKQYFDVNKS